MNELCHLKNLHRISVQHLFEQGTFANALFGFGCVCVNDTTAPINRPIASYNIFDQLPNDAHISTDLGIFGWINFENKSIT